MQNDIHLLTRNPLRPPYPRHMQVADFAMGCFWGVEKLFWTQPGVWTTAVGYAAGTTVDPSYEQVCTGRTGHTEAVRVVFDPSVIGYADLLVCFWEGHDPTQGMRQGNDIGTQYRSGVYYAGDAQQALAERSQALYQQALEQAGMGVITTEVAAAQTFYFAETYHQQYLAKNPTGYCGLQGTGVVFPRASLRAAA